MKASLVQPTIRKNFKDTAFWQPDVVTGADGKATVKVDLPDNLTTWRATARGVTSDTKVGATKYKVVARKDVIMRLETPRFITQGDTVTLSGIVHNYLERRQVNSDFARGQMARSFKVRRNRLSTLRSKASIGSTGRSPRQTLARSSCWPRR